MSTELTIWTQLITLMVGWLLGEASSRRREISSHRQAISRAIADLLEVRHRTFELKAFMDEATKKFKIPPQGQPVILAKLRAILPVADSLAKRYNESVDVVASSDPLLGFRLRSKDALPKVLTSLEQLASQDPAATQAYPQIEAGLLDVIKPQLDDLIIELAKTRGWFTWWKVKKYLRKPSFEQKDVEELLSKFEILGSKSQPTES